MEVKNEPTASHKKGQLESMGWIPRKKDCKGSSSKVWSKEERWRETAQYIRDKFYLQDHVDGYCKSDDNNHEQIGVKG